MLGQMLGAGMGSFQAARNWRDDQDERRTQRGRERELDQKLQTAMGGVQGAVSPGVAQVIAPSNAGQPVPPSDAAPTAGTQAPAQQSDAQQGWSVESSAQRFLAAQAVALAQGPEVYERVKPVLEASRQHLLTVHAQQWVGDARKPQDAIAFAGHMAHGAALLGMPKAVEDVKRVSEWAETIRKENYAEALQMLQMGDVPRAVEAFNRSGDDNITMDDIQIKPVTIRMGNQAVPTFEATVKRDGQSQTFNVYDSLFNSLAITEQADMLRKNEESRALVNQRDASADNSRSAAEVNRERLTQARMQTDAMRNPPADPAMPSVRGLTPDQERDLKALDAHAEGLQAQLMDAEPDSPRAIAIQQELAQIHRIKTEALGTQVRVGDVRENPASGVESPQATGAQGQNPTSKDKPVDLERLSAVDIAEPSGTSAGVQGLGDVLRGESTQEPRPSPAQERELTEKSRSLETLRAARDAARQRGGSTVPFDQLISDTEAQILQLQEAVQSKPKQYPGRDYSISLFRGLRSASEEETEALRRRVEGPQSPAAQAVNAEVSKLPARMPPQQRAMAMINLSQSPAAQKMGPEERARFEGAVREAVEKAIESLRAEGAPDHMIRAFARQAGMED